MKKQIDVIVPIYNALDDVKLLLESMNKNFDFQIGNVYLMNDCSNQETSDYLQTFCEQYPNYNLINNEENLGFIKTCNKGMKLADSEIVVLLNSDTKIPKSFCKKIIKCFDADKSFGVASPIGSCTLTYFIPLPDKWSLEKMNKKLRRKHKCCYPVILSAEGFCFCIRKEVIEQQGYLDEVYGKGYHEEVDFAYRAITNGWKNVLIDDLYVYHKRQASFGAEMRAKLIAQNNPVFNARWSDFRKKYIKDNNLKNPMPEIKGEIFNSKLKVFLNKIINCEQNIIQTEEDFYKFSFIMPTYNRGFCICNAIDSLLQQTYQNFDLIIADDGSTDNTEEIIKQKYHKEIESKKIIYIKLKHKGCSYARNIGLKNINSTWVAYLDSDNEISPNFLETYCEAIKHNSNHKCFYSQIRKDEQLIGKPFNYMELCDRNYIDLGTFVHHKSLIGRCGKFDTKLKRLIDWDLILKYTKKYPAYFIEEVLISYNNADFERISNSCSYAIAKKQIEKNIKARETSFLKKIFSVRNDGVHKLVSVLGIRMRFKSKKKEMEMKINSIQRNLDILRKQSNLNTEKLSRILEILEPTSLEQEEGEELILN